MRTTPAFSTPHRVIPQRVGAQPEGEFSYREAIMAYESGSRKIQIRGVLPIEGRCGERGPRE